MLRLASQTPQVMATLPPSAIIRSTTLHSFTYPHQKTHCGVSLNKFKRLLQRSIRCGDEGGYFKWCIEEIVACSMVYDDDSFSMQYFKATMTNIVNTLKLISIEDVSPRCVADYRSVFMLLNSYITSSYTDCTLLLRACHILKNAKKLRCCSHLSLVCHPNSSLPNPKGDFMPFSPDSVEGGDLYDLLTYIEDNSNTLTDELLEKVHIQAVYYIADMYKRTFGMRPHDNVEDLYHLYGSNITKKKKLRHIFWNKLMVMCRRNSTMMDVLGLARTFFEQRPHFKEQFLCLIHAFEATLAFLLGKTLPATEEGGQHHFMQDNWARQHEMPDTFPDYARKRGKCSVQYILEHGFRVNNEDEVWKINSVYENYMGIRLAEHYRLMSLASAIPTPRAAAIDTFVKHLTHINMENMVICDICNPNTSQAIVLRVLTEAGQNMIIKEMKPSTNRGVDSWVCYVMKAENIFQLPNMPVVKSQIFSSPVTYDREGSKFSPTPEPNVYFFSDPIGEYKNPRASTHKHTYEEILDTTDGLTMFLSILIFRGLLGVTNTNKSNILMGNGQLYSVNENFIFRYTTEELLMGAHVKSMVKQCLLKHSKEDVLKAIPSWLKDENDPERTTIIAKAAAVLEPFFYDAINMLKENVDSFYQIFLRTYFP